MQVRLDAVQVLKQLQVDILSHVLGDGTIAEKMIRDTIDHRLVRVDDLPKRFGVAKRVFNQSPWSLVHVFLPEYALAARKGSSWLQNCSILFQIGWSTSRSWWSESIKTNTTVRL